MDEIDYRKIRHLFDEYLQMYSSRDDRLTTYFSEDFSGFTGGGNFLVKDREEWIAITRQDFAQVKDPIHIELKELAIQSLSDTIAVTTGFFTIHLPIEDHILSQETARLVLIFRKESADWKITHSSISIPYYLVREGEVYPLKGLEERNQYLENLVTERTTQLSEANDKLHQTNEALASEIADHKQDEDALRESEALYRSILNASPDDITITDMDGHILLFSPVMLTMFRCHQNEEELLGRLIIDFLVPEDRERAMHNAALKLQGIKLAPQEYRALRMDATTFDIEVNTEFIRDTEGKPYKIVYIIRDITERKQAEVELQKKNAEIEQFIYTVSHDLRSPLVTVKTFLGYLGQDMTAGDSDHIVKDMEFINSAADRMKALLDELLEISRIGRAVPPHETVTFRELASEAFDAVAGQIATMKVDVRISDVDLALRGDRHRLLQIWQNLLDNAVKYMGDQVAPHIEIGVITEQDDAVFFVCDNGIGIAPEYQEKVFGIFEQMDRTSGGVGMGLTMVKRIVELYGGRIRVESRGVGLGSCFRFTLPKAVLKG